MSPLIAKDFPGQRCKSGLRVHRPRKSFSCRSVPGFDGLDGVYKRLFQNALPDGSEHEAEQPSLEVLAVAYHDHIHVRHAIGLPLEGVRVSRRASHVLESVVARTTWLGSDQS